MLLNGDTMWLALIMICADVDATSCGFIANTHELQMTEEKCVAAYDLVAQIYIMQGAQYVSAACFQIGSSA